jgi:hypothetical protein
LSGVRAVTFPERSGLVFWPVFAARLVVSWRRADGDRRQQLKWLMAASTVAVAGFVISNTVPALDPAAIAVGVGVVLPVPRSGDLEVPAI